MCAMAGNDAIDRPDVPSRTAVFVGRMARILSVVGILALSLFAVFASERLNDGLAYPWVNVLSGPFGFLRCDNPYGPAWKGFAVLYIAAAAYFAVFCDNIYFRCVYLLCMVWGWGAIGFCSVLLYGGPK